MPSDDAATKPRGGTRRLNHEGSVGRTRQKDKRYRGYVQLADGTRQWVSGRSRADVARQVAELRAQLDETGGTAYDRTTPLGDYLRAWITRRRALGAIRPSTLVRYEEVLRLYVEPRLGSLPLGRVRPEQIEELYAWMLTDAPNRRSGRAEDGAYRRRGVTPSTVQKVHVVLHAALREAERRRAIPRNPAALVVVPKAPAPRKRPVDLADVGAVLNAAEGDRLEALIWLALATGLRAGELFGLRWPHVNLDAGTITVQTQARRVASLGILEDEPKSGAGERTVSVLGDALVRLGQRQREQAAERAGYKPAWRGTDRVFTNPAGGYLEGGNFKRRVWVPLLARAGLPYVTFHQFTRHGHGSLLAHLQIDAETTRARMGHASVETTFGYYVEGLVGADARAARKVDRALREAVRSAVGGRKGAKRLPARRGRETASQ